MPPDLALTQSLVTWYPRLIKLALPQHASLKSMAQAELMELALGIRHLSRGFTRQRELAGKPYLRLQENLAPYLLYFWPVSYAQTYLILKGFVGSEHLKNASILDVGSGAAPSALAALELGAQHAVITDQSRAATGLGLKLAQMAGKSIYPQFWDSTSAQRPPPGQFDLIILSHTLNELWSKHPHRINLRRELLGRLAAKLKPHGRLVIIEPALKHLSRELIALRDSLLAQGMLAVLAPCLSQNPCPCLRLAVASCQAEFNWSPPSFLTRLAHLARLGKESLVCSFQIFGRRQDGLPSFDHNTFRVVSERLVAKTGRSRYLICGLQGRISLQIGRDATPQTTSVFKRLKRYDLIRVKNAHLDDRRCNLAKESTLKIIT